jgi:zinc protease
MPNQLPSGLTVHVEENHTAPVAAIQIWVKVGSADEKPDEAGIAHLHEHMLFKGTKTRGPGEVARAIEAAGGEINAWTSFDQTVYHVTIASRFWQTGLEVLADAVSAAAFDPEELAREIEVVCEEIKRGNDSPGRVVSQALFGTAYQTHPYGMPVIGTEESVRSHTRDRIVKFYRRWYRPENMTVVVTGDVREAEVVEATKRFFHFDAQAQTSTGDNAVTAFVPAALRPVEPKHVEPRAKVVRQGVRDAQLMLSWPAPPLDHDDVAALDAMSIVLGHGEASRLFRALKRDKLLVSEAHASCYTPQDRGLTMATFTLPPENLREAIREATKQLHKLRTEEISSEDLERACKLLENDAIYSRETVQGQARKLGFYLSCKGGLELEQRYFARLAAMTPQLILEAAQRWLDPKAMAAAALLPTDADPTFDSASFTKLLEEISAEASAERLPPPAPALSRPPPVRPVLRHGKGDAGQLIREKLPGGGTLLIREERAVPLVAMRAVWNGGLRAETKADGGAQYLLARLASKGTASRGGEQLVKEMEEMGGSLGGNAGRNSFGLRAEALSRHFAKTWEIFAESIHSPSFREPDVQRELSLQKDELHARDDNPAGATFQLFAETIYREHPYRLDMLGTQESLAKLDGARLSAIRSTLYPAGSPVIAVVGDVDPQEVRARVLESLGMPGQAAPKLNPAHEPKQTKARAAVRALEKAQAHLVIGYPGLKLDEPDRDVLEVLSTILSGQGGRLFIELRDKKSLAYSVSAFAMEGVDPGWFAVYIGCGPNKVQEALTGIREQLDLVRQTAPSAAEIDRARTHMIGTQAIGLQRNSARAALMAFDEAYGLGAEFSNGYAERVSSVTAARVQELAQRLLKPELETLALIAPQAVIPAELIARAEETKAQ